MKRIFSMRIVQLLILVLIAAVLSVILTVIKTNEYSDWVRTDAVITDWKTAKDVNHILYFRYVVNGMEHNGRDIFSGNLPKSDIGNTVTVWYDPDDVSRVMISDTKPDAGLWTYSPFILAFPISLYIMSGGSRRRSGNRQGF